MASNPDDIARSVAQQNAYGGIYSTQYADAQKASRANQIAREIGLPADVVESDFPNVAADHRIQQGQMLAATTPQAATWLSDPRNAAAVSNDYSGLTPVAAAASKTSPDQGGGVLSSIGHFFGDVGSSVWNQTKLSAGRLETLGGRMMTGMGNNLSAISSALPVATPAALVGKFFGAPVKAQGQALVARTPTETEGEKYWNDWHYSDLWHNPVNFAKKVVPSTIYSIANSVPAIVETAVGKGAPLAADITEQTAEARARNNGRADPNAWDYALAVPAGIISAALFRHARVADVAGAVEAGSQSILKSLGETAVRDASLGGAQAGVQYTGESVGTDHGFHLSELASRSAEAAMANATMGVAIHGVGSAITAPVRAMRDVAVARDGADYVDTVMDAASQSKSRTQSPQEFQSFIDAHVKDSPAENMYIPGEAISALFQTAEGDPSPRRIEQDPFWSKYAQQVDDATRMGGDVVVPLSDLATHLPGTGDWNQLREQVRFNPGGMSLAEAKEYATQKAPEDIEKAVTELSARMDQEAGGLAATRKAYQLYRDMGMSHTEAATAGVLQGSWIKRVNEVENAKREASGQPTLTPAEEWDRRNISGVKTTEGTFRQAKTPEPPEMGDFDALPHLENFVKYVGNKRNSLNREAVAKAMGIKPEEADKLTGLLASVPNSPLRITRGKEPEFDSRGNLISQGAGGKVVRKPTSTTGAINAIDFLMRRGGIRNDEAHDLGKSRGFAKRFPYLIRKKGLSIDGAGELLHEAGYFDQYERPDVNQVLEMLEHGRDAYPAADRGSLEDARIQAENKAFYKSVSDQIDAEREGEYKEYYSALDFTKEDREAIAHLVAQGEDIHSAIGQHMDWKASNVAREIAKDTGDDGYDVPFSQRQLDGTDSIPKSLFDARLADAESGDRPGGQSAAEGTGEGAGAADARDGEGDEGPLTADQSGLTPEQQRHLAEMQARLQQSMLRRGGQVGVGDQAGGLFDNMRDQGALFQTARGNISIARDAEGRPQAAIIRAFESANFSTAVHEMGHYWIEDLRDRALRPDATEQERTDWQTVKGWFGELGHPVDDKEMIPEDAHEFWARGVERYIMEGKAPSHELNGVFARMAQWMRKLYQSVTALNAPISPEVRDVMDRLLASDSEIEAARGDMKMNPLEGAEALMTEAERAAYHNIASESREQAYQSLLERVMETVKNRRTREYNAQKKELRDDVTSQIDQQPVYRALKTLRNGEDGEKVKLPKQWLIDNYGEDAPGKMPKGIDPLFADEGMDPEEIASHAGFDSADQMVHALMDHAARKAEMKAGGDNRSPRQADIDEGLKARIEQDIPDPYHDLETEARASIATDKAGDLMSMEARALSRKTGQRPAPWDLAKKWAQGHLQDQTTRDALTGAALARYARSVAKAGKLTEEALMKGDFEQALIHKNQQILNAALLQEAKRVKEQVETASRKMKRIANARTMPSIDQDYLDQAHALLEQVRMTTESGKQVGRIKSFERWYTDQVAEGREPIVPIEYSRLLGTVHWTSLKVGDLLELNDVISQIVNIGRLKQTLLDGKDRRDFEGAVGELVERQKENPLPRKQSDLNNPFNSMTERVKSRFRSFDAVNLKFEQLMNFMDNALPNGPWQRMLMNPLSAAQAKQSRILRPLLEDLNASIKAVPKDVVKGWTREVDTPELKNFAVPQTDPRFGQPWRFTKDQLLAMALNLGNDGNKQRLLDGYRFEEADVRAVLDRHLTEHDWKFVQSVFDTVGKLWPHIEELERNVNGFAPEKVEATPIETRHGTFEGGYFPAIYDPLYSSRADVDEMRKLTGGGFFSVNTRAGATNERAESVMNRPLLLSLSVVTRHLNEVVHDLAFREPAGQVKRLLKDDRIRQAISDLMGPEFYKKSLDYLENVAFPNVADSKQDQTIVAFARALNKRITTAGLGYRISTILQQPTAFSNTMAEVGNVRYGQFFAKYLQHPKAAWEQVSGLSEEMRERAHNLDANINAMYEEHSKNTLVMGPSKIAQLAYKGIAMTDLLITIPGWMAAFDKATTDLKMSDDDAVHYADMVIRKTQGAGSPKDQAAIQRTIWMKAFNPFFSYWSAHYNQLRSIGHEARRVRDADHVFNLTNRFILAAILPMAIQGWFFGGPQNRDDGESHLIPRDAADLHYLLKQIVVGNLGAIPGMNALTSHLAYGYDYKVSPWSRFEESAEKTGKDIKQAYTHEEGDGDAPKSWIKDSFDSFAYFSGQPVSQIGASLQGLYDYSTDRAHPQNAGEWADLMTKGRVPQHDR